MMTELKLCPFCGYKPRFNAIYEDAVECTNLECASYKIPSSGCDDDNWNSRPIEDALSMELEAAEKRIDDAKAMSEFHLAESQRLREELNQAVYMQEKVREERNAAEKASGRPRVDVILLREALSDLLLACDMADILGELSSRVDGSLLDVARDTLKKTEDKR